jgi:hypothetical protein
MLAVQQLDNLRQLLLMGQLAWVNSRCCCTTLPAAPQLQQRLGTQQVASLTAAAEARAVAAGAQKQGESFVSSISC